MTHIPTPDHHAGRPTGDHHDPALLRELGELASMLARAGGELAAQHRAGVVTVAATKSSQVDVVTVADREVEALLRRILAERRPEDSILGEEGEEVRGTSGLTWVIDPIDGTVNFLYGLGNWAVSVAVCAGPPDPTKWELLAGAVFAPALNQEWRAVQGQGAFRVDGVLGQGASETGVPLRIGTATELAQALVATGFGYLSQQRAAQAAALTAILPKVRDIRRLGSCAIDLCLVAEGTLDGYYESGVNPWDMAAGALVITEAGGLVRGLSDALPSKEMLIAGNGIIAAQLDSIVRSVHTHAESGV